MIDPDGFYACDYCKEKMGTKPKMVVKGGHYCNMDCAHNMRVHPVRRRGSGPRGKWRKEKK